MTTTEDAVRTSLLETAGSGGVVDPDDITPALERSAGVVVVKRLNLPSPEHDIWRGQTFQFVVDVSTEFISAVNELRTEALILKEANNLIRNAYAVYGSVGNNDPELSAAERCLDEFSKLQHGWDGYFGIPPTPAAVALARMAVDAFTAEGLEEPDVAPVADGSIELEARRGEKELHLYCKPLGDGIEWLKAHGAHETEGESPVDEIRAHVGWLAAES